MEKIFFTLGDMVICPSALRCSKDEKYSLLSTDAKDISEFRKCHNDQNGRKHYLRF